MKKIIAVLLMMAVLLCGCGSSEISQEEYDKVVAERDELKKDNENLKKIADLKSKVAKYQSRIDSEYEHAKFVLYVSGKVSGTEVTEYVEEIDDLHSRVNDSISAANSLFENLSDLTDYDLDAYDTTVETVDEMYESWEGFYSTILELEKYITGE